MPFLKAIMATNWPTLALLIAVKAFQIAFEQFVPWYLTT